MRDADREKFRKLLLKHIGNPDELIRIAMEEHEKAVDCENVLTELRMQSDVLSRTYQKMKEEHDEALQQCKILQKTVVDLSAQLAERKRDCFGRSSEAFSSLVDVASDTNEDPTSEDTPLEHSKMPRDFESAAKQMAAAKQNGDGSDDISPNNSGEGAGKTEDGKSGKEAGKGGKEAGKTEGSKGGKGHKGGRNKTHARADALNKLPHQYDFHFDTEKNDAKYGKGGWTIIGFRVKNTAEHVIETRYVHSEYYPVIKVKATGDIIYPEIEMFYPHSILSPSLLADIFAKKYDLAVPPYRLLKNTGLSDLGITDTTVYNWLIHFSDVYLRPVYDYLAFLMMGVPYHQCDETHWMVIRDGRKPGSKCFLWVHITSELWDGPKIIIIDFEKTRSADHLREFYKLFKGNIGCDAFAAYPLLEKENPDDITISGCMMHVRRRFFNSFMLLWTISGSKGIDADSFEAMALIMIQDIYDAETPLKKLSADERYERRQTEVRPLVEKFYNFLREIDLTDPSLSDKMRDAVSYALNHEHEVCRFLDDGNIAIDNGYCERAIKPIALLRRNCLFSTSEKGAEATAIGMTLTELARLNDAVPYFYFKFIFEKIPKLLANVEGYDYSIADFVPWSDKYREYEARERVKVPNLNFATLPIKPWDAWKDLNKKRSA